MRPLSAWQAEGVRRIDGSRFSRADVRGALLLPDGAGGEAFMVYANFNVIRRYNPSDDYALAVGLLGNAAAEPGGPRIYAWRGCARRIVSYPGCVHRPPPRHRSSPRRITSSAIPIRRTDTGIIRRKITRSTPPAWPPSPP